MFIPVALQLLALLGTPGGATLQPASVPARGAQEATLTLDRAGMIRLGASGGGGTSCTVVDHLRGPFRSDGQAGAKDCALDLLLDPGVYKVRLESPAKGKGTAALRAVPFVEQNPSPVRLEPGRSVEQPLASGQQASYWLHLDSRQPVVVRASGRTAGMVQLWRAGSWREDLPARDVTPSPLPGQPIHEWWIESSLEAGDYLVTVYGTAPLEWTQGKASDLVSVQVGFPPATDRALSFTLPPWGLVVHATPPPPTGAPGSLTALVSVEGAPAATVRLTVHGASMPGEAGACQVEPRALAPECVVTAGGRSGEGHLLSVRGPPGTRVQLHWAPRGASGRLVDGEYGPNGTAVGLEPLPAGEYLIGLHDVPADLDAAPLGCALFREPAEKPRELVAVDLPRVGPGRPLDRAFNTTGEQSLWFEVTGATAYRISTDPVRKERCELYRVDGASTTRLSRTADEARCQLQPRLEAGRYELRVSGGGRGIDRVRITAEPPGAPARDSAARGGCLVRARLPGGEAPYLLAASRAGAAPVRGLLARPLPLTLSEPLPLELPAGETLRLPVNVAGPLRARAQGGKPVTCALAHGGAGTARDGACWMEAKGPDELLLTAPADAPLAVWLDSPVAPKSLPPLTAFSPTLAPIPALGQGTPVFLDLAPDEPHAFTFRVEAPGLYHARTEGLLSTDCTLRTPTVAQLARDRQGGRGRNCLVAAYLDTGTYLLTVRAAGRSRGRAAVVLEHRPIRDMAPVAADGEAFFRVPAGDLVREGLTVTEAGPHDLSTAALGASLQCRLEDAQGWPLVPVPTACAAQVTLPKGQLLWTQLPLTVESMRHTRLAPVRPPVVLRGEEPHPITLWTRYAVELGKGGHDTFPFTLDADLEVFVVLTGGMQGRIYREGEDRPIELVPAQDDGAGEPQRSQPEAGGDGEGGEGSEEQVSAAGVGDDEGGDGEISEASEEEAPPPPRVHARAPAAPVILSQPPGRKVTLAAGRYRLVTEHSRGDVAISYALELSSEVLTPGMARDLAVPTQVTVRVPRSGTLRLRTRGDADVRCRLFDAAGKLAGESSEVGSDWNCGLAQPLAAGDYTLVLEAETQTPGATRLILSAPATVDTGALEHGRRYTLGDTVLTAALPAAEHAVLQLELAAAEPFSCALEDEAGAVISSQLETRACAALLHPLGKVYRVRLWSTDSTTRPVEVEARLKLRPVVALSGGKVPAASAGRAQLARAGRYHTAEGVQCAPAEAGGLFLPCGPEVSLEAGATLFASPRGDAPVPLEELTTAIDERRSAPRSITRRPLIEAQTSLVRAVHLLEARAVPGERAAPFCAIEGGVHAPGSAGEAACYAASSPGQRSTARVFAPSDTPVEVSLSRLAVPLPAAALRLEPGRQVLALPGAAARYTLPEGPARLELLLPPATWAVLLAPGPEARVLDLCPPAAELARCVLQAQGGELLLSAPRERRVEATVLALPAPPRERTLGAEPWEARLAPGTLLLRAAPSDGDRVLELSGASACLVRLSDGSRLSACTAPLPAGTAAEILVDADGPLRAVARSAAPAQRSSAPAASFGRPLSAAAPVRAGEAVALIAPLVERSFSLAEPSLVHLRADAGVCALGSGAEPLAVDGLGRGCAIDRLLPAGTHRLAVRPFGGEPLAGTIRFTAEPVEPLTEGVGPERWIAPGETRMFRFHAAARGKVGLGLQQAGEVLECTVLDAAQRPLATGCQALLDVDDGDYLLAVHAPGAIHPARFRPVVLGLAGAQAAVPDDYLRDLFQRIGDHQP